MLRVKSEGWILFSRGQGGDFGSVSGHIPGLMSQQHLVYMSSPCLEPLQNVPLNCIVSCIAKTQQQVSLCVALSTFDGASTVGDWGTSLMVQQLCKFRHKCCGIAHDIRWTVTPLLFFLPFRLEIRVVQHKIIRHTVLLPRNSKNLRASLRHREAANFFPMETWGSRIPQPRHQSRRVVKKWANGLHLTRSVYVGSTWNELLDVQWESTREATWDMSW